MRQRLAAAVITGWVACGGLPVGAQFQAPRVFAGAPAAFWIFPPGASGNEFGVFHFRRVFELKDRPSSFVVHVSADNRYRLFVNGEQVSSGPQRSDLMHWWYEAVDLAPGSERAATCSPRWYGTGELRGLLRSSAVKRHFCCKETARAKRS